MATVKKPSASKAKAEKSKKEDAPRVTIVGYVTELLEDDPAMSTQDMITKVKKKFPESAFSKSHVAYYRNSLRKKGMDIPLLRDIESPAEEKPKAKAKAKAKTKK